MVVVKILAIPVSVVFLNFTAWLRCRAFTQSGEPYLRQPRNIALHALATVCGLILGIGAVVFL